MMIMRDQWLILELQFMYVSVGVCLPLKGAESCPLGICHETDSFSGHAEIQLCGNNLHVVLLDGPRILIVRVNGAMVLDATLVGDVNILKLRMVGRVIAADEPDEIMRDRESSGELADCDSQKISMLDGAREVKVTKTTQHG